jgi:uncharacterized protein YdaL
MAFFDTPSGFFVFVMLCLPFFIFMLSMVSHYRNKLKNDT